MAAALSARRLLTMLTHLLSNRWDELRRLRLCVMEAPHRDHIHDLRVACRRLRAAIGLLVPLLGPAKVRRLEKPIRTITRALGTVRNLDEAHSFLLTLHDEGLMPLAAALQDERQRELRRCQRQLQELPCKRLERQLAKASAQLVAPQSSPDDFIGWLSHHDQDLYRPIRRLLRRKKLAALPAERHRLRIALKKWRYFNELLALLLGQPESPLVERLKAYQTVLGDLNDREVFLDILQHAAGMPQASRRQAEKTVATQHRRMTAQFQALLIREPLTYQCLL